MVAQVRVAAVQGKPERPAMSGIVKNIVENRQILGIVIKMAIFVRSQKKKARDINHDA